MAIGRSIRNRRVRRRIGGDFELPLTSMMDVLVIILVFLLKSYSASQNNFASVPGLQMPYSVSPDVPRDSLQVIVTPEGLTFENERILDFVQSAASLDSAGATYTFKPTDLDGEGRIVRPLLDALIKARDKSEVLRAKSSARDAQGNPLPFEGILAIQADKRVSYETIRKIMGTAYEAGFKTFRFLAVKRET